MNNLKATTADERAGWKRICDGTTPGPWESRILNVEGTLIPAADVMYQNFGIIGEEMEASMRSNLKTDADFVSLSRMAMPRLLADVERLNTAISQLVSKSVIEFRKGMKYCDDAGLLEGDDTDDQAVLG